jgi:hypothetical protein
MFYCESCRIKNGWPGVIPVSTGPCEMCGQVAACYDVASKYLPRRNP